MMRLLIVDRDDKYTDEFFDFVKEKIRSYFYTHVKVKKLEPFEVFINESPEYKFPLRKYISCYDICIAALYNIVVVRYGRNIVLKIDENSVVPNTNIKLIDLCKLINEGNLVLKAYPIFTEIFNYVKNNIEDLNLEYALR